MKKQFHFSSGSEARRGKARSIICRRGGTWSGLLLAVCCAVLIGLGHPARAAVTEAWVHRYSNVVSNANDRALTVVSDAAGDNIVTGVTDDRIHGQDMLTIKYSGADGTLLWQQRYNGSANRDDYATAVAVDGNGNVVVTGYSNNGTNNDYYSAKYAATNGALLWEQRYNGPGNSDDQVHAVAVDGSGNVVVTGSTDNGDSNHTDYYTAKYAAADGTLLWERRYNGPANGYDVAYAVTVDGGGNVVVTGSSGSVGRGGWWDYYTAKYAAASGALLWEQRYNGPANKSDYSQAVAVDGSGNVVVTGYSEVYFEDGSGSTDNYTAKYAAANGALVWEKRSKNQIDRIASYDRLNAVAVDDSGNVIVTGDSYSGVSGYSYYTAKYAATDGALLWERRSDCGYQAVEVVAVDGIGNVVVTGSSLGDNGYYNYYTAKHAAADGALLWEQRFNSPANDDDPARAVAVAVDARGNVVVIGASNHGLPNYDADYYTAKYMAADGALLWEKHYNSPANGPNHSEPRAAGVDGSGNVVVTGSAWNSDGSIDYYTAKYAALDGALLWEQRHNGPKFIWFGFPNALAVDSSGNVVVTGASRNSNLTENIFTAKYAAADGVLLWENRCNCGGGRVVVDGSGNVVVTGAAQGYTAKYAATDGARLWEQRYTNGYSTAVAVDASGNVVVTGSTHDIDNYHYTAKYAAADGALLWENRYSGAARGLVVDGSGNVVVAGGAPNDDNDYYTAKYAAENGARLWEKRHNGYANAVAMDGSGNVVVTGPSGNYPNYDYYTAKYAAADGTLLWEKRYRNSAPSWPQVNAVGVDISGNVVMSGSSASGATSTGTPINDYYTAKYAAADGALLWEQRYNGPANGDDMVSTARCLAIGPNGMVAVTGSSSGNYATVVYRDGLLPVSITRVPTGVRLRFNGVPDSSYTIERAPAVTGPWTPISTATTPIGGVIEYVDINSPVGTAFYRTSTP